MQIRFNPHDYGTIQEIADEITNIQGIKHDTLVKYFGVELHKVQLNKPVMHDLILVTWLTLK